MKKLFLFASILCLSLHFWFEESRVEEDILSTKQSAVSRKNDSPKNLVISKKIELSQEEATAVSRDISNESIVAHNSDQVDSDDSEDDQGSDDEFNMPWADIEEGWRTELKLFLTRVEAEKGEEIYQQYMEEKKKFAEKIGSFDEAFTVKDSNNSTEEYDGQFQQLENAHQENIKEIFGDHYSEIKNLHESYLDSVQYLNRSDVQFSMSL